MILRELTSVAIITMGIVSAVYIFFWDRNDDDSCLSACIFCRNVLIDCEPTLNKNIPEDGV